MLRTRLCDVLGIELPIIGAPFGPWEAVELAAAVCEAGGLGSVGTAARPLEDLREQWRRLGELTEQPFAVNHTLRPLDMEAFEATVALRPAAISFHIGVPADLIARAHDAGILWIQQVMDRSQAEQAVSAGADVIVAQGGEAGGNGGWVSTMVLVPQVLDIAGDIPVVAAGGIADGRGLAAVLSLGAQGVSIGTRLLASVEMGIAQEWKQRIVAADAVEAVKMINSDRVMPPYSRPGVRAEPRTLVTPLVEQLRDDPDGVDPSKVLPRLLAALRHNGGHDDVPFAGQSVGLIHDIRPAADIIAEMVTDAEAALSTATRLFTGGS